MTTHTLMIKGDYGFHWETKIANHCEGCVLIETCFIRERAREMITAMRANSVSLKNDKTLLPKQEVFEFAIGLICADDCYAYTPKEGG